MILDYRIFFYLLLLRICIPTASYAQSHDAQTLIHTKLAEAASLAEKNNFERSLEIYQDILSNKDRSEIDMGSIYFNAGNIAIKLKKTGFAHLYLIRSRLLMPMDDNLQEAWQALQTDLNQNSALVFAMPGYPSWFSDIIYTQPALFLAIALISTLSLGVFFITKNSQIFITGTFSLFALFFLAIGIYGKSHLKKVAIVLHNSIAVRSGPSQSYPDISTINSGSSVIVESSQDEWKKIIFYSRQSDKKTVGWVQSQDIQHLYDSIYP